MVTPNITVTPGTLLFLVVESLSYPASGLGVVEATEIGGTDEYPPGEFVYINTEIGDTYATVNGKTWTHRSSSNEDLASRRTSSAATSLSLRRDLSIRAA
jgi:hypothetical protein